MRMVSNVELSKSDSTCDANAISKWIKRLFVCSIHVRYMQSRSKCQAQSEFEYLKYYFEKKKKHSTIVPGISMQKGVL